MATHQTHQAIPEISMISIEPARLADYVRAIFAAAGASQEVAGRMANSLVDSNLAGHDSHGVIRITQYLQDMRSGQLDPRSEPVLLREGPAYALVNGNWGFGHETARFSMALAIEKARAAGIGAASAVCCNHIGRLGEWAEQAAAAHMIGLATVGFGSPKAHLVAPYGGARPVLSTNPIAIGAPRAGSEPLLLDFATSISPEGKVRVARDKGVPLPEGVLIDKDGNPTTDPNALYAGGALLPLGGHKGYALAMMVEVLSTALSGADEPEMHAPNGANSGSFFLVIDPAVFRSFQGYAASIERLVDRVTAVPPAPGFGSVLLPGEPEQRSRGLRASAISLPPATWSAIAADAQSLGVPVPDLRDRAREDAEFE
jgi:uncharacterized oxidoreductase